MAYGEYQLSTRSEPFKKYWQARRALQAADIKKGKVTIRKVGERIHVSTPFNPEYVTAARQLGRWKEASKVWTFPLIRQDLVIELCERVYGKQAITMVGFPAE